MLLIIIFGGSNMLEIKPTSQWTGEDSEKWLSMSVKERLDYDDAQLEQELPRFVEEFNRLCKKYGDEGGMTEEMVRNMDYFEDFASELTYYGGVHHAQCSLYGIGCIPANEVEIWNE